ncbi:MAG: hypothetical protein ACRDP7_48445 [Trebonia sp.]
MQPSVAGVGEQQGADLPGAQPVEGDQRDGRGAGRVGDSSASRTSARSAGSGWRGSW